MKDNQSNIIDKITEKYLSEEEFLKLKNILSETGTTHYIEETHSAHRKRTVSRAKFLKYSKHYSADLIAFINENILVAKRTKLFYNLANEFNDAGFNDLSLKLYQEIMQSEENTATNFYGFALFKIGKIYSDKGSISKSNSYIKKALKIFVKSGEVEGLVRCYNLLGCNQVEKFQLIEGTVNLSKCLSILDKKNNNRLRAKIETNLAVIYSIQGNYELSLYYSRSALVKFERFKDFVNIVIVRFNMGANYYELGKYEKALKEYDKSLVISIKHNILYNIGFVYQAKGRIYLDKNDVKMATAFWRKGAEVFEKTNDTSLKYWLLILKGAIYRKQKMYKKAEKYLLENSESLTKHNNIFLIADNELELGRLYKDWGKKEKVLEAFGVLLKLYAKMNSAIKMKQIREEMNLIQK